MAGCLQVITMIDTREHADAIGKKLLEKRLAACVQTEGWDFGTSLVLVNRD
jgi:uncharacterized protein involved in tolerance to divalent cations